MGLDRKKLNYTALYDTDKRYKQGPNGEEKSVEKIRADLNTYFYKTHDHLGKSSELNTLGNVFLRSDRIGEAVLVFEFNSYFFRHDPYILGSYAKGLTVQGETKKAKEFYKRALKIHPENKWIRRLYEELLEEEPEIKEPALE